MKVKNFIALFQEEDMEKEVYIASDAEGNDYSKLVDATDQVCVKYSDGEVGIFSSDEPEEYQDHEPENVSDVVVLWRA